MVVIFHWPHVTLQCHKSFANIFILLNGLWGKQLSFYWIVYLRMTLSRSIMHLISVHVSLKVCRNYIKYVYKVERHTWQTLVVRLIIKTYLDKLVINVGIETTKITILFFHLSFSRCCEASQNIITL